MDLKKFWICATLSGIGPSRLGKIIERTGSLEKVFQMSADNLKKLGVPSKIAEKISGWKDLPWQEEVELCKKHGVRVVVKDEEEYPPLLREIYAPPYMLYVKGRIPAQDNMTIAIVGTRNPSLYGTKMAGKFASELAYLGFTVVSGLARGIDTAAHKGALKAGGKTIGVLGSGFNNFYPPENIALSNKMAENGAVITEFRMSSRPEPSHFPLRNRIVAGMSRATLVIEAGQKSGALITANLAADQGREVFAIPGQVDNLFSKGVNSLLKEGAGLVENVNDIIDALNMEVKFQPRETANKNFPLSDKHRRILESIGEDEKNIEELMNSTGMNSAEFSTYMLELLVKKLVVELPGKFYRKNV